MVQSCQPNGSYNHNYSIDRSGWHQDSTLIFDPVIDRGKRVSIAVDIRNNNLYPYQNLYLFIQMVTPSDSITRDTIEYTLCSPSGKFRGSAMLGVYSHQIHYKDGYLTPDSGSYHISIRQAMRIRSLPGIEDLGLRLDIVTPE